MKKVQIEINLYSYNELDEKTKDKVFYEHKDFLDSLEEEYENENGELIKEYIDHNKETVEDSLKINEYLFFKNGNMAKTVFYTGKHERAGEHVFYFEDKEYILN